MIEINSTKNQIFATVRGLADKKARDASGLFVAEGASLLRDMPAHKAAEVTGIFVAKSAAAKHADILARFLQTQIYAVDDKIFGMLADTVSTNGILAVLKKNAERPLGKAVVVFDGLQDPGNIGTVIRTAVAMGVEDFLCIASADAYGQKSVRASMGGIYYANVINCDYECAKSLLKNRKTVILDMYGRSVFEAVADGAFDASGLALVLGSEAAGVSDFFRKNHDDSWCVPMPSGKIESLNAAVCMSIVLALTAAAPLSDE